MARTTSTTLILKRAFLPSGNNSSLEEILSETNSALPNYNDRHFVRDLLSSYCVSKVKKDETRENGLFVWFSLQDSGTTGLINTAAKKNAAEIEELGPPDNKAWVQSEILLYVSGNHVIACNLGVKDKVITEAIKHLARAANAVDDNFNFSIEDVPNTPEIERINSVGVKSIELNVTSYLADLESLPFSERRQGILNTLTAIFGTPPSNKDIKLRAATSARVTLTRGKFSKEENEKDEWLTNVGETIVSSELDNYKITLEDKTRVSTTKIRVSKPIRIKRFANTLNHEDAELKVSEYFKELQKNGSLAW